MAYIGIMVSGRLKCLGSAQHLRHRFGQGYQLDVNVAIDRVNDTISFIRDQFIGSSLLESQGRNLKYRIIKTSSLRVADIFRVINRERQRLGISEYSVSDATLEQIFINFARTQDEESNQHDGQHGHQQHGSEHGQHDGDSVPLQLQPHDGHHDDHRQDSKSGASLTQGDVTLAIAPSAAGHGSVERKSIRMHADH